MNKNFRKIIIKRKKGKDKKTSETHMNVTHVHKTAQSLLIAI